MTRLHRVSLGLRVMLMMACLLAVSASAETPISPDLENPFHCSHGQAGSPPSLRPESELSLTYVTSFNWRTFVDVEVRNHHAFCLTYFGVQVYDLADPSNPELVSQLFLKGRGEQIVIQGIWAFVADGGGGLKVLDISNPLLPTQIGEYNDGSYVYNVNLKDWHAYLSCGRDGFRIVDVGVPYNPQLLASRGPLDAYGIAYEIAFYGNYAYLAVHNGHVALYDVSDPRDPQLIKQFTQPGWAWQATRALVYGSYMYLGSPDGLAVVSLTDPQNPQLVKALSGVDVWQGELRTANNRLYVGQWTDGFSIFDITDPPQISRILFDSSQWAYGLTVTDDKLLVVGQKDLGVYSLSGGGAAELAKVQIGRVVSDMAHLGDKLVVSSQAEPVRIYDVSNPAQPVPSGTIDYVSQNSALFASGDHLYVGAYDSGMYIYDLSTPTPALLSHYRQHIGTLANHVIVGDYAYLSSYTPIYPYQWYFEVVDIHDRTNPVQVKISAMDHTLSGAIAFGSLIVAHDYSYRHLWVIDVSDPVNPVEYRHDIVQDQGLGLFSDASHVYFSACHDGTHILDLSDPSQAQILSTVSIGDGSDHGGAASGNYIYVAHWMEGLQMYNVSDPAHPTFAGSYAFGIGIQDVIPVGDYLYVRDELGGIAVFRAEACCEGVTGNVDCDQSGNVDISDLSVLIDQLFISLGPACCTKEANIDGAGEVDISDLTLLIDHLFMNFSPLGNCSQ